MTWHSYAKEELTYTHCGNLNLAENEGIQKEVQKHVADFEATFGVISIIPR